MPVKICSICGKEKPLTEYYKILKDSNKYRAKCKSCYNEDITNRRNNSLHSKFLYYIRMAKYRNIEWELTEDEFKSLVIEECHYCGDNSDSLNGVDRIDNDIGYLLYNCYPCCKMCNQMKYKYSEKNFIDKCKEIIKYQGE